MLLLLPPLGEADGLLSGLLRQAEGRGGMEEDEDEDEEGGQARRRRASPLWSWGTRHGAVLLFDGVGVGLWTARALRFVNRQSSIIHVWSGQEHGTDETTSPAAQVFPSPLMRVWGACVLRAWGWAVCRGAWGCTAAVPEPQVDPTCPARSRRGGGVRHGRGAVGGGHST